MVITSIQKYIQSSEFVLLSLFIVLGIWLRVYGLSDWYWSPDDALHLSYATAPSVSELFSVVLHHNTHSPGFFLLPYMMLKISDNELFLRSVALVPGVGLIIIFYFLGKEFKGKIIGLFMAFYATFDTQLILLSQVIRQYTLLLCLMSVALLWLLKYRKNNHLTYLYGYLALAFFAINIHYTAVIFIFSAGIVLGYTLLKQPKHLTLWVIGHAILAIFFTLLVYYKYHTDTLVDDLMGASEHWLRLGFPGKNMLKWVDNFFSLILLNPNCFQTVLSIVIHLVLFTGGVVVAVKKREVFILLLLGISLIANIALAASKIYPLMPGRWCIYTLPFILLVMAQGFDHYIHYCKNILESSGGYKEIWKRENNIFVILHTYIVRFFCTPYLHVSAYLILSFFVALALIDVYHKHFLRIYSATNFNITHQRYEKFKEYFFTHTKPGDIVFTTNFLTSYLAFERRTRATTPWTDAIHEVNYHGRRLFYFDANSGTEIHNIYGIRKQLRVMEEVIPDLKHKEISFATVGWGNNFIYKLISPRLELDSFKEKYHFIEDIEDEILNELSWRLFSSRNVKNCFSNVLYGGGAFFTIKYTDLQALLNQPLQTPISYLIAQKVL